MQVNYFQFVAEEVRAGLASLGLRSLDELVGRADLLKQRDIRLAKTTGLDLSFVTTFAGPTGSSSERCVLIQILPCSCDLHSMLYSCNAAPPLSGGRDTTWASESSSAVKVPMWSSTHKGCRPVYVPARLQASSIWQCSLPRLAVFLELLSIICGWLSLVIKTMGTLCATIIWSAGLHMDVASCSDRKLPILW